jgi:hypothetical protein
VHRIRLSEGPETILYAKEQPEYEPVWGTRVRNPEYGVDQGCDYNTVLIGMRLTTMERFHLLEQPLVLHLLTYGHPLTPHIVTIGTADAEEMYGVKLSPSP